MFVLYRIENVERFAIERAVPGAGVADQRLLGNVNIGAGAAR